MKVEIHTAPPAGFHPEGEVKIFSPVSDPNACVMVQLWSESPLIMNPRKVWVAVRTERVEKIRFLSPEKENNEQISNNHSRRH